MRTVSRSIRLRVALVVALTSSLLSTAACVKAPPNLTPQATVAFTNTRVQKALDLIRDTVDDGSKTVPPVFSGATDVKVATWHQSAITIIHATGSGWKPIVLTSLDELLKDLPAAEQHTLTPYLAFAKTLINQVVTP